MSEIVTIAKDLMIQLASVGIKSLVVGSCLRDVFHGNPVKDIDVIVSESADQVQLERAMSEFMDSVYGEGWSLTRYEHYEDDDTLTDIDDGSNELSLTRDFASRVFEVWKFEPPEDKDWIIDILFVYNDKLESGKLESFVKTFDFSLNQCWMDIYGNIHGLPLEDNKIHVVGDLPVTGRTILRHRKLSQRYPQYDWSEVKKFFSRKENTMPKSATYVGHIEHLKGETALIQDDRNAHLHKGGTSPFVEAQFDRLDLELGGFSLAHGWYIFKKSDFETRKETE